MRVAEGVIVQRRGLSQGRAGVTVDNAPVLRLAVCEVVTTLCREVVWAAAGEAARAVRARRPRVSDWFHAIFLLEVMEVSGVSAGRLHVRPVG